MEVIRKNLKEDRKLLVSLRNYHGEPFEIVLTAGRFGNARYVCSYKNGVYTNCEPVDGTHVMLLLDNHGLPCGLVTAEISVYEPDAQMQDGNFKLHEKGLLEFEYEGKKYHLELTNGKSDEIVLSEVTYELLANVMRGEKGDPLTWDDLTDEQKAQLKGEKGDRGDDGRDGVDGKDGRDGVDGRDGIDGKDGRDGVDGGMLYPAFTLDPHNMHLYVNDGAGRLHVAEDGHLKIRLNNNA